MDQITGTTIEETDYNLGMLGFIKLESEQSQCAASHLSENPVLIDPLDKLSEIFALRDFTVDDLIHALQLIIQEMSVGHVTIHCGLIHDHLQ